jgi:hypothetical protein
MSRLCQRYNHDNGIRAAQSSDYTEQKTLFVCVPVLRCENILTKKVHIR